MRINWKVRLKNKVWLTTMAAAIISVCYQILEIAGITPAIPKEQILDLITLLLTIFAGLGIIVDPTTDGAGDSDRAMSYEQDYEQEDDKNNESKMKG